MKEKFDFDRIGKRMPYTTPDGFFDDMENSIMQCIKQEVRPLPYTDEEIVRRCGRSICESEQQRSGLPVYDLSV